MTIYLGADHAGFQLKENLKKYLADQNLKVKDLGNTKLNKKDDYPQFAQAVAAAVSKNKNHRGILICGSGQGMCMAANKHKKIRAAMGYSLKTAKISRQDNDSNILCLAGRVLSAAKAKKIVMTWLDTDFSKLKRYENRIQQLNKL
jgi:ribose 5-phosphate isomerase B